MLGYEVTCTEGHINKEMNELLYFYRKHKNLSNSMVFADFIAVILQPVSCLHYGNLHSNEQFISYTAFYSVFLTFKRWCCFLECSTLFYILIDLTSSLVCYASCASLENITYCALNFGLYIFSLYFNPFVYIYIIDFIYIYIYEW